MCNLSQKNNQSISTITGGVTCEAAQLKVLQLRSVYTSKNADLWNRLTIGLCCSNKTRYHSGLEEEQIVDVTLLYFWILKSPRYNLGHALYV